MEPKAKKGKEETTDKIDVLRSTDKQSVESVEPVLKKTSGGHQWTMVVAGRPATRAAARSSVVSRLQLP